MYKHLIIFSCLVCFVLLIYGINWGLPSRWCVDEPVARALGLLVEKSLIPKNDYNHPTFHYFVLLVFFLPVLIFMKIMNYPLDIVEKAGSISWIYLSNIDQLFQIIIYIIARLSSALFAILTVYLVYRIAKECYSKKAGVFSALFLSVTMGFISEAHTAKSTAFLIFMIVLTIFSCIYCYEKKSINKYTIPFLLGGFTLATKYNGGIIILPLAYYLFKIFLKERQFKEKSITIYLKKFLSEKKIYLAMSLFLSGFFIGFPSLFINIPFYHYAVKYYRDGYIPQSYLSALPLFISGFLGNLITLKDIFGIVLFFLVTSGVIFSLTKFKINFSIKLILFTVIPYYIIFSFSPNSIYPKYIIPIVPLLIILSAGITHISDNKKFFNIILVSIWLISLKYVLDCDAIYAYKDIRYLATDWVEHNIDKNNKIIIIGFPEWTVHNRLFKYYDIIFINYMNSSFNPNYNRHFVDGKQYNLSRQEVEKIVGDLKKKHDYFIIYPVFIRPDRLKFWVKREIKIYGIDIKMDNQRFIKGFSRRTNYLFWNPNLGGYEPDKIIITHGIK